MEDLSYGAEGYAVKLLQYALIRAGEDPGRPDGIFGRRTRKALLAFQRRQGLAADGVAGRLTWAAAYPFIAGYALHAIAPGDTLYALSRRFDTGLEALLTANPGLDPLDLPVGEVVTVPLDMPVVAEEIDYSALLTGLILKGLTMRYPFISVYEIGRSVMGQRIWAASLGSGKKRVGYNGAHHANEWITTPLLLRFLEDYAQAYASRGQLLGVPARALFECATLHMVPLVNPDGVDLVTGALSESDSYYAQAKALSAFYPAIPFPRGWKSNIAGVDLNLQYPANWEQARRVKFDQGFTRPGPRDFVGFGPLTAPESRAMAHWTKGMDFALTLSYHTQGRVICWQHDGYAPPASGPIGEAFGKSSGYALEETSVGCDNAGYTDWFLQTFRRPGFTVEAGKGQNPLPLSDLEAIYKENLPIFLKGIALSP